MNTDSILECITCQDDFILTEDKTQCGSDDIDHCTVLDNVNIKTCHSCEANFILTEDKT